MDEALRTYIRVVELQSFTKAAEELHISQPAVSLQLKKLEEIYETELIYRQAKKFILTATGEILYHRAKQLEGLYKQVEDEISLYHHHLKGRLRIGASFTIGEYFLPEVIAKFHALYPDITIELIIENTAKIADKVELLQVDTGLIEGQVSKKDLEISAFSDDEMCIVGRADGSLTEIEQGATWIAREEGSGTREYLDHVLVPMAGMLLKKLLLGVIWRSNKWFLKEWATPLFLSVLFKQKLHQENCRRLMRLVA